MVHPEHQNLWRIIKARDQSIRDLRAQLNEGFITIAELRRRLDRAPSKRLEKFCRRGICRLRQFFREIRGIKSW